MSIDKLTQLAPPPSDSVTTPWQQRFATTEQRLGISLPSSLRILVSTYGRGSFGRLLWLFLPSDTNPHLDLTRQIPSVGHANREYEQLARRSLGFRLNTESCGLWPWGVSDTGDYLYFDPIHGHVVTHVVRAGEMQTHAADILDFIVRSLTGEIITAVLGREFAEVGRKFIPE